MNRHLMIATVVFIATVAGSFPASVPVLAQGTDQVDVTSALLLPADLDAIGLADYGTGVGAMGGPDALEAFDRTYRGAGADDQRFLSGDGIDRGATLYLLDRTETEQPARVLSSVVDYGGTGAASDAYDAIVAARSNIATDTDRGAGEDLVADAGVAFVVEGVPPYDEADFRQTSVIARSGTSLIEVAIERQDRTTASFDDIATLLAVVLGRLGDGDDDAPALAEQVPELTGPEVVPALSRDVVRDGEQIPQYGQSDEDGRAQAATFEAFETTDVYQFGYTVLDGGPSVSGFVSRHDSDAAARAYFRAIPDLLSSNDRYDDVRVGNAIVRAGDSATLVTYGIAGTDGGVVTEVIVLLGGTVAELIVNAPNAVSSADMTAFAQAVEACATGGDCQPLTIPDDASFGIG